MSREWTKEEEIILKLAYPSNHIKKLLLLLPGRSQDSIYKKAGEFHLYKEESYRKSFPEKLLAESPLAYYWTGFILGDGYINIATKACSVHIGGRDREYLNCLAEFLGIKKIGVVPKGRYIIEGREGDTEESVFIKFRHEKFIAEYIEKFDFKKLKTYNPPDVHIYQVMPKILLHCLFIGYIDAEGSIIKHKNRKNCYNIAIAVHKNWLNFLQLISDSLSESLNIKLCNPRVLGYRPNMCSLNIGQKKAIDYLLEVAKYSNLPVLSRKWGFIT